jgi:RNA polymerase sigma factor (sigma-70 family)
MTKKEFQCEVEAQYEDLIKFAHTQFVRWWFADPETIAEDTVQKALSELAEEYENFQVVRESGRSASAKSWMITRVRSRCIDALRQRKQAWVDVGALDEFEGEENNRPCIDCTNNTEEASTISYDVRKAVESLPEDVRQPIELIYFEGYTQEETALKLCLSRPQVVKRLDKARSLLSKALKAYRAS